MESKVKHTYDSLLKLVAPGTANITTATTTASTQVAIDKIVNGRGDIIGRFGEGSFDVVVHIVALDHTTGDETYTVSFNSYDSAGANAVTHATRAFVVADLGKTFVFKFDTASIGNVDANAFFFGLSVVTAGTTPILGWWAYIAPNKAW